MVYTVWTTEVDEDDDEDTEVEDADEEDEEDVAGPEETELELEFDTAEELGTMLVAGELELEAFEVDPDTDAEGPTEDVCRHAHTEVSCDV